MTGNWLVDGNPLLVLLDINSAAWKLDRYKHELFEKSGIGIPHDDTESNDAVIFGYMAAQFIAEVLTLIDRFWLFKFIKKIWINYLFIFFIIFLFYYLIIKLIIWINWLF